MKLLHTRSLFKTRRASTLTSCFAGVKMGALTLTLLLLPIAAFAQDADEKPTPPDPHAMAMQNTVYAVVLGLVALGAAWYWWRRWQITHSGNSVDGTSRYND